MLSQLSVSERIARGSSASLRMTETKLADRFCDAMYPGKLSKIINLFESLPEDERRETLVSYADNAKRQEPREGENFDLVDVRKDEECTDTVGVYLHVDEEGKAHIRMTLGPEVQTLTRAMTAILCKGLDGSTPQEILDLPSDFVTRIVGTELVRVRSQTVYYVLTRIKSICKVWLDRQRMAQWRSTASCPSRRAAILAAGRRRIAGWKPARPVRQVMPELLRDVRLILFAIPSQSCAKITSK